MNTLNSNNYDDTLDFLNYCSSFKNVEKINFNPIKILHKSYENLRLTKEMVVYVNNVISEFSKTNPLKVRSYYSFHTEKIMNCCAGITSLSINYNGAVAGCIFGASMDDSDFIVGNIMKSDIEDLWNERSNWGKVFIENANECRNCGFFGKRCTGLCKIELKITSQNEAEYSYLCRLQNA